MAFASSTCKNSTEVRQECPVCFSTLTVPVFQCHDGHLICEPCLSQLTHCPICRERYPEKKIRARAFENVIKGFLVECKNKKFGCTALLHVVDFLDHDTICKFKGQKCPGLDGPCDTYLDDKMWADHLKSVHRVTGTSNYELGKYIQINQDYSLAEIKNSSIKILSHFIKWEDHKFYVRTQITPDKKFIRWAVTCVQPKEKVSSLKAIIKVSSPTSDDVNVYTKWTGPIVTNQMLDSNRADYRNQMTMLVAVEQLQQYSNKLLAGHYAVEIMVKITMGKAAGAGKMDKPGPFACLQSPTILIEEAHPIMKTIGNEWVTEPPFSLSRDPRQHRHCQPAPPPNLDRAGEGDNCQQQ